jgi:hypothetical protein
MNAAKVYLVWTEPAGDDSGYWSTYTSREDAYDAHCYGVEIFIATPRSLGKFKRETVLKRIAKRKRKVKH